MGAFRWEFRVFGVTFGHIHDTILKNTSSQHEKKHDETYLICPDTRLNIKIRMGFLEIKRLKEVAHANYQLWEPLQKANLPIQGIQLNHCFEFCEKPELFQEERYYDEDEILHTLIRQDFFIVPIKKSRLKFEWDGLLGEYATLETPDYCFHSVALESTDPHLIKLKQKTLNLEHVNNQSYPDFLLSLYQGKHP